MPRASLAEAAKVAQEAGAGPLRVESATRPGVFYTVDEDGCTCPGFGYGGHCKHHDQYTQQKAASDASPGA